MTSGDLTRNSSASRSKIRRKQMPKLADVSPSSLEQPHPSGESSGAPGEKRGPTMSSFPSARKASGDNLATAALSSETPSNAQTRMNASLPPAVRRTTQGIPIPSSGIALVRKLGHLAPPARPTQCPHVLRATFGDEPRDLAVDVFCLPLHALLGVSGNQGGIDSRGGGRSNVMRTASLPGRFQWMTCRRPVTAPTAAVLRRSVSVVLCARRSARLHRLHFRLEQLRPSWWTDLPLNGGATRAAAPCGPAGCQVANRSAA